MQHMNKLTHTARELAQVSGQVLNQVEHRNAPTVITRQGKVAAYMIPALAGGAPDRKALDEIEKQFLEVTP